MEKEEILDKARDIDKSISKIKRELLKDKVEVDDDIKKLFTYLKIQFYEVEALTKLLSCDKI